MLAWARKLPSLLVTVKGKWKAWGTLPRAWLDHDSGIFRHGFRSNNTFRVHKTLLTKKDRR